MLETRQLEEHTGGMARGAILTPGRLLRAAVYTYALALTVYVIARTLTSASLGVFDLIGSLIPALLIPALVLLPLALILRRWRVALALLLPATSFVVVYGAAFVPLPARDDAPGFVLMTYNIFNGNRDHEAIASAIRASDADIVVLQEITAYTERRIMPYLEGAYAYHSLHRGFPSRLGLGVFSRYPLLVDDYLVYAAQSSRLRLQVEIEGRVVTIYNVHLANPFTEGAIYDSATRSEAVTDLLAMLDGESEPLIVAGDFNMSDFSTDYQRMIERYTDAFREAGTGLGLTFPAWSPFPVARLDYVFHGEGLRALNAEVWSNGGSSDHLPVRVELAFND